MTRKQRLLDSVKRLLTDEKRSGISGPLLLVLELQFADQRDELEQPMGCDARAKTADRVTEDRLAGEAVAMQRVHHGNVGRKIPAPAHADCREDRDII